MPSRRPPEGVCMCESCEEWYRRRVRRNGDTTHGDHRFFLDSSDNLVWEPIVVPTDVVVEEEYSCDWCGEACVEQHQRNFNIFLCGPCNDRTSDCEWCDCATEDDSLCSIFVTDRGESSVLCEDCRDNLRYCHSCDRSFSDDAHFPNYDQCEECYERSHSSRLIESWNYRPEPEFIGSPEPGLQVATYFMGLELETDNINRSRVAGSINDLTSALYCKEDGSLSDGVEIVSHPGTLEAWQDGDVIPWRSWTRDCTPNFPEMRNVRSAGIHIHVSRTAFMRKGKWSASHLWKFMQLHYRNEAAFQAMAGRQGSSFAGWNATQDRPQTTKNAKPERGDSSDRYRVINVNNRHTVECRYFQADERKEIILKDLELVHAAVEYTRGLDAKSVSKGLLDYKYFRAWYMRRRETYPDLALFTSGLTGLIKNNRFRQKEYRDHIREQKERLARIMEREMDLYDALHVPPPQDREDLYYDQWSVTTRDSLRHYFRGDASRSFFQESVIIAAPSRITTVRQIVRRMASTYAWQLSGIDGYHLRNSGLRDEWRTVLAWHAWDIVEALRETTEIVRDEDIEELHTQINRFVVRN